MVEDFPDLISAHQLKQIFVFGRNADRPLRRLCLSPEQNKNQGSEKMGTKRTQNTKNAKQRKHLQLKGNEELWTPHFSQLVNRTYRSQWGRQLHEKVIPSRQIQKLHRPHGSRQNVKMAQGLNEKKTFYYYALLVMLISSFHILYRCIYMHFTWSYDVVCPLSEKIACCKEAWPIQWTSIKSTQIDVPI